MIIIIILYNVVKLKFMFIKKQKKKIVLVLERE